MSGMPPPVDKRLLSDAFRGTSDDKSSKSNINLLIQLLAIDIREEAVETASWLDNMFSLLSTAEEYGFINQQQRDSWFGRISSVLGVDDSKELYSKWKDNGGKPSEAIGNAIVNACDGVSAARGVSIDKNFMMSLALAESGFRPNVKAGTSSATGLYQFIESTWRSTVEKHGHQMITEQYPNGISTKTTGFMNLRKDPAMAAQGAAHLAIDGKQYLLSKGIENVGSTEMYLAHFLGKGGAKEFLTERQSNGNKSAASVMGEKVAVANRGVFYTKSGAPRSLDGVYAFFDRKFNKDWKLEDAPESEVASKTGIGKPFTESHDHAQQPATKVAEPAGGIPTASL